MTDLNPAELRNRKYVRRRRGLERSSGVLWPCVTSQPTKNRGRAILGFEQGACGLRGRPIRRLALHSPALRVGAGKSGVEGVSEG
jgi:hypothetical protein